MSIKSESRQKIEYHCNKCHKKRLLFLAPNLQNRDVDSQGYTEYIDVHYCINNRLAPIKLFVDKNFDVRTQVPVKEETEESISETTSSTVLGIPKPKKSETITSLIKPTKDFISFNVKKLIIEDNLRDRKFILEGKEEGNEIKTKSILKFITITGFISSNIQEKIAEEWLEKLADILEPLVYLDEKMLSYLGTYLDHMIENKATEKEILELDMLFQSSIAIPHSMQQHIDILEMNWKEIFPHKPIQIFRLYKSLISACLDNETKTLLEIYQEVKDTVVALHAFPFFLSVVRDLVNFGFINLEKLEFYTA